ncbi:MAG: ParB/RepB/Spo0J family partition protein [Clostridia bacterium]|nr:ParB/RepB/Spo0J family partition protein [Clostridia bacterium]
MNNAPALRAYSDIFGSTEEKAERQEEIRCLALTELHSFAGHPFSVRDDDDMQAMVESVKQYGVMVPAIARPAKTGGYEIIAGHRRKHACELAGLTEMPVMVRDLDDDAATICMADSNLQREHILPSEWAFALKMKLDAISHQGRKGAAVSTSTQVVQKCSADTLGAENGMSRENVRRYIRLTYLIQDLLAMVDANRLALNTAVELSYLKEAEQHSVMSAMDASQAVPSLVQAKEMKKASVAGGLTAEMAMTVLSAEKKDTGGVKLSGKTIRKYFPKDYTPAQIEKVIVGLLENWKKIK